MGFREARAEAEQSAAAGRIIQRETSVATTRAALVWVGYRELVCSLWVQPVG